jgi:hypothetical protein
MLPANPSTPQANSHASHACRVLEPYRLVGSALGLSVIAVGTGAARTRHSQPQKGLRCQEAYGTTLAISCYTLALMIFLPVNA